jgi:hypothetical protein
LNSCSTEDAELVANDFHQKLDEKDYDYICDNLIDTESDASLVENFREFFVLIDSWGLQTNREKTFGFSKKTSNGVTTVKLNYEFDVADYHMYERMVLVERAEGYKVIMCVMNSNEMQVETATADY